MLFGEAGATGPWSGCSSTCLAAARRFLSCSLREMRCLSAHSSHRVCPSIASFPQFLQRPKNLASLSVSLNLARCLSFLASGVSGVRFGLGPFGCRCFLLWFALEADFCFLFVLASSEVSPGGTREAVLRVGCSSVGVPVERFLLAVLLFALDAALYLLSTRAGSRNVYWRVILLEYCAGATWGGTVNAPLPVPTGPAGGPGCPSPASRLPLPPCPREEGWLCPCAYPRRA